MPLKGARYRMKDGVRLAFQGDQVVEAKNMKTGEMHTQEEFEKDKIRNSKDYKRTMSSLREHTGTRNGPPRRRS